MTSPPASSALEPAGRDPSRVRLSALEQRLETRERELEEAKAELRALQTRYFTDVGALYTELGEIEAAVADLEIRLGLRPPLEALADKPEGAAPAEPDNGSTCSNRGVTSAELKRVFRDLAKAIHPDRALDGPERYRRHSLMAEANRAYAERDEDRLRLILHAWERSPGAVAAADPAAESQRVARRVQVIDDRLIAIDAELADLRASAIGRLQSRIDEARAQGWDLMAEIVAEVKRQIARARARLATLRRGVTRGTPSVG